MRCYFSQSNGQSITENPENLVSPYDNFVVIEPLPDNLQQQFGQNGNDVSKVVHYPKPSDFNYLVNRGALNSHALVPGTNSKVFFLKKWYFEDTYNICILWFIFYLSSLRWYFTFTNEICERTRQCLVWPCNLVECFNYSLYIYNWTCFTLGGWRWTFQENLSVHWNENCCANFERRSDQYGKSLSELFGQKISVIFLNK